MNQVTVRCNVALLSGAGADHTVDKAKALQLKVSCYNGTQYVRIRDYFTSTENGTMPRNQLFIFLPMGLSLLCFTGCGDKSSEVEIITLEGKIESIDRQSERVGVLTVTYYSEKHKQEMSGIGRINAQTEITINGVQAKLADLREGDRVRGEVRVVRKKNKKSQIALKINVVRPKPIGDG